MPMIFLKEFGQHNGQYRQEASLLVLFFSEELGFFLKDF